MLIVNLQQQKFISSSRVSLPEAISLSIYNSRNLSAHLEKYMKHLFKLSTIVEIYQLIQRDLNGFGLSLSTIVEIYQLIQRCIQTCTSERWIYNSRNLSAHLEKVQDKVTKTNLQQQKFISSSRVEEGIILSPLSTIVEIYQLIQSMFTTNILLFHLQQQKFISSSREKAAALIWWNLQQQKFISSSRVYGLTFHYKRNLQQQKFISSSRVK